MILVVPFRASMIWSLTGSYYHFSCQEQPHELQMPFEFSLQQHISNLMYQILSCNEVPQDYRYIIFPTTILKQQLQFISWQCHTSFRVAFPFIAHHPSLRKKKQAYDITMLLVYAYVCTPISVFEPNGWF